MNPEPYASAAVRCVGERVTSRISVKADQTHKVVDTPKHPKEIQGAKVKIVSMPHGNACIWRLLFDDFAGSALSL
jgi:hypothetical protein